MSERAIMAVVSDLMKSVLTVEQQIGVAELAYLKGIEFGREMEKRDRRAIDAERKRNIQDIQDIQDKKKGPHTPKEKINPLDNPTGYLPPKVSDGEFEDFWAVYPRKVGKGAARKAYRNARKRASEDQIIAGAKRYAESRPDPEFTKHPATWLNADCWLDEPGKVINFHNPPKRSWAEIKAEREAKRET